MSSVAYGFLFGVYPSLVADTFGIRGMSQNWGSMTLSAIIFGNIFNLTYGKSPSVLICRFAKWPGRIYDSHVSLMPDGRKGCPEGRFCYNEAYWVTSGACILGLATILWCIRHDYVKKAKARKAVRIYQREA